MKEGSSATTQPIRQELQAALTAARTLPAEALIWFLGDLEIVRATAWARLTAPVINEPLPDELLDIHEAARRLGASTGYLYHNCSKLPFTRHVGRNLRFSAQGIQKYIQRGYDPWAKRAARHGGPGAVKNEPAFSSRN